MIQSLCRVINWPSRIRRGISEAIRTLPLPRPDQFLHEDAELLYTADRLVAQGSPIRVLESGAGEIPQAAEGRSISSICRALAASSGGELTQVVFSRLARARLDAAEDPAVRVLDGHSDWPASLEGQQFDLLVLHPAAGRGQTRPLPTFWSFLELQRFAATEACWAFTRCGQGRANRCDYLRDYLGTPLAWGNLCLWRAPRPAPGLPPQRCAVGDFQPFSAATRIDRPEFFRLYDQIFAPMLRHRASTFRTMFELLLAKPAPYLIIETGTTRPHGDITSNGQSSVLFDLFVNCFGGRLISIDCDCSNLRYCRTLTSSKTTHVWSDSVAALRQMEEVAEADLIYLDSYDFDERYPHPSSLHHLKELAAVWNRTKPGCLLAIDDCFGPDLGKHAYVAGFLRSLGMSPCFTGYQTGWLL